MKIRNSFAIFAFPILSPFPMLVRVHGPDRHSDAIKTSQSAWIFLVDLFRIPVDLAQFGKRVSGTACLTPSRKAAPSSTKWCEIGQRQPLPNDGPASIVTLLW
jgi:hypothetical protein